MKLNNLWRTLMNNWIVKVFSLLLAIGVYLVINYATLDQRKVDIPLEVIMPIKYQAVSTVPKTISLIIKTDSRYSSIIDPWTVKAKADFSNVDSEGVKSTAVILSTEGPYASTKVYFSSQPEVIRIYFALTENVSE
jgi:hypothetical protein